MQSNPYETPPSSFEDAVWEPRYDVVDRKQRQTLAALMRQYLSSTTALGTGDTTAFATDDFLALTNSLPDFFDSSDSVVRHAALVLDGDMGDREANFSKPEWDHFQRLLLLLESDCHLQAVTLHHWRLSQAGALAGIVGYGTLVVTLACLGYTFLWASVPFGLLSMYLLWRGSRRETKAAPAVAPFGNFSELLSTRRAVEFHKTPYPQQLAPQQQPATARQVALGRLVVVGGWMLLAPIILFCQMFPETETQTSVVPG